MIIGGSTAQYIGDYNNPIGELSDVFFGLEIDPQVDLEKMSLITWDSFLYDVLDLLRWNDT